MSIVLLDTNVVVYAFRGEDAVAEDFIASHDLGASVVTHVETLGYSKLDVKTERSLRDFFAAIARFNVDDDVVERAITLRRRRAIKLGDSLIAATAIVHGLTLATRNVKDFAWIEELVVVNPYDDA